MVLWKARTCGHVPLPPPDTVAIVSLRPSGTEQLSSSLTPHNTGKSMCTDNCLLITTIPFSPASLVCLCLLFDLCLAVVTLVAFSKLEQPHWDGELCDGSGAAAKEPRAHRGVDNGASLVTTGKHFERNAPINYQAWLCLNESMFYLDQQTLMTAFHLLNICLFLHEQIIALNIFHNSLVYSHIRINCILCPTHASYTAAQLNCYYQVSLTWRWCLFPTCPPSRFP